MAYRRRHGFSKASTFTEEIRYPSDDSSASSLAAQAIRASSAHRDSSLSSAYGESALASAYRDSNLHGSSPSTKDSASYEYTSMKSLNESKYGFWGVLARKAKAILEDDNVAQQFETPGRMSLQMLDASTGDQPYLSPESCQKTEGPRLHKGLDAITSSLNYIGGTIGNAFEEGLMIVENRTADIIQETRKLHIRKKGSSSEAHNQGPDVFSPRQQTQMQAQMQSDQETQLKASRDVAMAMAAKAKLLLRELKTVKADLAFAKERCAQLEEENRILRESHEKGDNPEDDDLIRLQLETLLAEKARLAHENSIYTRENRFLREIVEYHQLTMQDILYLDEGIEEVTEEVTEVCPISIPAASDTSVTATPSPLPPPPPPEAPPTVSPTMTKNASPIPTSPPEVMEAPVPPVFSLSMTEAVEDPKRHSLLSVE
ncbi:hypothetical protein HHK36_015990 [Tetracentron sinense]|uniref:Uncharacterized protein n=1 Tax=Tetracentron sinense TaxID=13715 RepID=A0A835DAL0_TETSI|nr:hypothetical protein HHK36_015990 [Tetracentron sinense]